MPARSRSAAGAQRCGRARFRSLGRAASMAACAYFGVCGPVAAEEWLPRASVRSAHDAVLQVRDAGRRLEHAYALEPDAAVVEQADAVAEEHGNEVDLQLVE